jgi:hypothetical protein
MAKATIRISESTRTGQPIGEDLRLCGDCAAEYLQSVALTRADRRKLAPIADGPDCDYCDGREAQGIMPGLRLERGQWVLTLALVLCLLPALASAQTAPKGPQAVIIAGNVLDAVSTEIALQRPGLREGNAVLGQSPARRLALKAAGTAAQVWIVRVVGRRHPRAAKIVGYGAGVFLGGVSAWNFSR